MPWMIVLAAYFAVGFTLIFVGPAARARRREQIKWEWHPARRLWIQKILTLLITFGTFAFWPVFTVWGKRELHDWIAAVQIWHPHSLPYETYLQIRTQLPWFHQESFRGRLSELDCVITGLLGSNGRGRTCCSSCPVGRYALRPNSVSERRYIIMARRSEGVAR